MLAALCPACSRPCSLAVAEPERITCAACGFDGEAPEAVSKELREAASVLSRIDSAKRQFDARTVRLISRASRKRSAVTVLAWVLFAIPALFALLGGFLLLGQEIPSYGLFLFTLAPAVLSLAVTVFALRAVRESTERLAAMCAATPSASPGAPSACRVCGGPVRPGSESVVRCDYCGADNAVSSRLLEKAARKQDAVLQGFAEAVQRSGDGVAASARKASLAALVASLGSPVFSIVSVIVIALLLSSIETKVKSDLDYAEVETPKGPCIALVTRYQNHVRISYGASKAIPFADRPGMLGLNLKKAGFLDGKNVFSPDDSRIKGRVIRVHGSLIGKNVAVIRNQAGAEFEHDLEGLCLSPSTCCP